MDARETTVLVVDDEVKLCRILLKELERAGFAAKAAHDRDGALSVLAEASVDAMLLDIALPGTDGVRILEEVRVLRPDLPVIMLTGTATVETAVRAMKLGAYDYLTKPYALADLLALVAKAVGESRARREAQERRRDSARRLEELVREAVGAPPAPTEPTSLADLEKAHILRVLAEHGGNRTRTARALGIDAKTLYNKLKDYGAS